MREEDDLRQRFIPWKMFDDLRDATQYQYADVQSFKRMRERLVERFFGFSETDEPTLDGVRMAIDRSRFGDVLRYLEVRGIIKGTPLPPSWNHAIPKVFYVQLFAVRELQSKRYTALYGGGASYDSFAVALSKAIGELLERYTLLTPTFDAVENGIESTSFIDERIPRALIERVPRFYPWQTQYVPNGLTEEILKDSSRLTDTVIHAAVGDSLSHGSSALIPLQHIQWGQHEDVRMSGDTYVFSPKTTNGAGGGFTIAAATVSGLCELVERDGFLIYWLNKISPPYITIDTEDEKYFSARFINIFRSLQDRGFITNFIDTTTDIAVPSVACVIKNTMSDGAITVTGKCHVDPVQAIESALLEHMAFLNMKFESIDDFDADTYVPFSERKIGKSGRINLWASGKMTDQINFFLSGKRISFREWSKIFSAPLETDRLSLLISRFKRLEERYGSQYEVFRYRVRHPILTELGYSVVKLVVPALMPLYLREDAPPLDCERLRDVPGRMGFAALSADAYNPMPHPFP